MTRYRALLNPGGRIIVSSLENVQQSYDTQPVQRIHWQRCIGLRGSTASEISKVLRAAGVEWIEVWAIARAERR